MRRHDKPIHGSCAIYFPGGIGVSSLHFRYLKCLVIIFHLAKILLWQIPPVGNDSKDEKMSSVIHNVEYNPEMEIVDNESSILSRQLYNQLNGIWISSAWLFSVSVFWDG